MPAPTNPTTDIDSRGAEAHPLHDHPELFLSHSPRAFLARALTELGEFRQATTRAEEVIEFSRAADSAFGLCHGLYALGLIRLRQGDFERAVAALEQSFDIARAWMVTFLAPIVGASLGHGLARLGRVQQGLLLIEQARHEAKAIGHWGMAMLAQESLAEAYLLDDRKEDAAEAARDALDTARGTRRRGREARLLHLLGDIVDAS